MTQASVPSEEWRRRPGARRWLAALLALTLVAPLAGVTPAFGVHDPDPEDPDSLDPSHPPKGAEFGLPFWRSVDHDALNRVADVNLHDVDFPTPNVGYAVGGTSSGAGATVVKYDPAAADDPGRPEQWWKTWTLRNTDGDALGTLNGVHFVDEAIGYVAGEDGVVLKTVTGGEAVGDRGGWSLLDSEEFGDPGEPIDFEGVHAPVASLPEGAEAGDIAYVVGNGDDGPVLLKTVDGGKSWRTLELGMDDKVRAVSFPTVDRGYVLGKTSARFTRDGGKNFDDMDMPAAANNHFLDLRDLDFPDPSQREVGYAVGQGTEGGFSGAAPLILKTDDGQSWEALLVSTHGVGGFGTLRGVAFSEDGLRGQAVGEGGVVLVTDDGGERWRPEPVDPRTRAGDLFATIFGEGGADGVRRVAVGSGGVIAERVDDPGQADPSSVCVPFELVEALEGEADVPEDELPEGVRVVCDEHTDPDSQEVETGPVEPGPEGPENPPVDGECKLPDEENPAFPCLREFEFANEHGEAASSPARMMFDPGLRRAVGVSGGRVFLYDIDNLKQRGVQGFGRFFDGATADNGPEQAGVVNLEDALDAAALGSSALDTKHHRLYGVSQNCSTVCNRPPRVVAVSLNGEFAPSLYSLDELFPGGPGNRPEVSQQATHLAVDERSGMVYVLVSSGQFRFDAQISAGLANRVTLHALAPEVTTDAEQEGEPALVLQRRWSLPIDEACGSTTHGQLNFMGVSNDGRDITFGCQGAETSFPGQPQFTPNGIMNVQLPKGVEPRSLNDERARTEIGQFFEPAPGIMGTHLGVTMRGDEGSEVVHWRAGDFQYFFDFGRRMWVGTTTVEKEGLSNVATLVAADREGGRLYLSGGEIGDGQLRFFELANLPGRVGEASLSTGASDINNPAVFDPETRRLLGKVGEVGETRMAVFEDRVPLPIPDADVDPDESTHDIDEEDANSVDRFGATAAYGTRVWWTGLQGSLPGTYLIDGDDSSQALLDCATKGCPRPGGTYGWVMNGASGEPWGPAGLYARSDGYAAHGRYTGRFPWKPHDGQREVLGARVEEASLSGILSSASALAMAVDDGSSDDAHRRRGPHELHEQVDSYIAEECSEPPPKTNEDGEPVDEDGEPVEDREDAAPDEDQRNMGPEDRERCRQRHEQFHESGLSEFEDCTLEFYDRLLREVDGDRRAEFFDEDGNRREPCGGRFEELDRFDPRFAGEDDPGGDERIPDQFRDDRSLEERFGWTRASSCTDPGNERDARGSEAICDLGEADDSADARTEASAEQGMAVEFPGSQVTLSVDATRSDTKVFRDDELGMVSEVVAVASGVNLVVPEQGTLSIGEVRSRARAWAMGRPCVDGQRPCPEDAVDGAGSSREVIYEDVLLTHPDGEVAFACGGDGVQAGVEAGDERVEVPKDLRDGYGEHASEPFPEELPEDPACDPERVATEINRVFGGRVVASAPEREMGERITGSPGGARAVVRRNRSDYFAERVLFNIDRDEVPGLSLEVVADGTVFNRYKVDLAGVFGEAQYKIGQERIEREPPPAAVEVELTDADGAPLAGGRFEVWRDHDGDGAIGGADAALGSCVTGSDGVGDCRFSSVDPGGYVVRQTAPPPGYLAQSGVASVHASPGSTSTARFTNWRDAAGVEVLLVNPAGGPLEGGVFELTSDTGDGVRSCTTDAEGRCSFNPVPLGGYTLAQEAAPEGFEPTDAMSFALERPGQVAAIRVVNGRVGADVSGGTIEIIEIIEDSAPTVSSTGGGGSGGVVQMFRDAVADAFGFLLRNPLQALLFLSLFGVLFAPAYGLVRRLDLIAAEEAT